MEDNQANQTNQSQQNGNSQQAAQNQGQQAQQGQQGAQAQAAPAFDYEKLANILAGRQAANEESVLRGYFKQQGLSKEEADQAIAQFKEQKAQSTPDVSQLQTQAAEAQKAAVRAQIENKALLMAGEIGVELKTMPYILKMADLKDVVVDGKISDDKIKESLTKVLEDIPQLKANAGSDEGSGFRVGADTGSTPSGASGNDKLRAAFGLKTKT